MKKSVFAIFLLSAFLAQTINVLSREVFVRKKTVPGFFIPENAMKQPKTVFPTPQYYSGQAKTVKNISDDENKQPVRKVVERKIEVSPTAAKNKQTKNYEEDNSLETGHKSISKINSSKENSSREELILPRDDNPDVPEYQKKYQEYLSALEYVARGKDMPRDRVLEKDLSEMSSNARQLIEKRKLEDQNINQSRTELQDVLNEK